MSSARVRLSDADVARIWPQKHRVRLPPEFDLEAYLERQKQKRDRFRLPNIPDRDECKYIHGELHEPDAHYCGKPTLPGRSWCEEHHKLCTRIIASSDKVQRYRSRRRR